MSAPLVSVIVATQRRPRPLAHALASILAQAGVDPGVLELVVVDNDDQPSAEAIVRGVAAQAPFAVRYVHEPLSGVANARNAAVEAAGGDLIAFLDDDEEAPPGWLAALVEAQARFDADVVFGPVRARLPASIIAHRTYLEAFFSRQGPLQAGLIDGYYGCGDCLVRRAALPDPCRPFSTLGNLTGGEDDLLFSAMQAAGARFCWAPDAWVWEDPAAERLSLRYALRRAFVYGQGPTSRCANAAPPQLLGVVGWMAVGLAQAGLFGLAAAAKALTRAPDRAFVFDRAARGLGKLFWWGPFKINFYGRPAA